MESEPNRPSKEIMKKPMKFMEWLHKQPWINFSRPRRVDNATGDTGVGIGTRKPEDNEKS
jgi:hypothetical protein